MKLKNIAAICRKNRRIVLFEKRYGNREIAAQYIGDGNAAYLVTGLPTLDAGSLLAIFDISEKERDAYSLSMYIVGGTGKLEHISFEDIDAGERPVEREQLSITYSGMTVVPIQTRRGLIFIESRYLLPLFFDSTVPELYERTATDGTPYIAVKKGMFLQAVIMPINIISRQFTETLERLAAGCTYAIAQMAAEGKEKKAEQYSLSDILNENSEGEKNGIHMHAGL